MNVRTVSICTSKEALSTLRTYKRARPQCGKVKEKPVEQFENCAKRKASEKTLVIDYIDKRAFHTHMSMRGTESTRNNYGVF